VALTSRDVLFVLRAQDFVTRELRGITRGFGALGRQIDGYNQQIANTRTVLQENLQAVEANSKAVVDRLRGDTKAYENQHARMRAANETYAKQVSLVNERVKQGVSGQGAYLSSLREQERNLTRNIDLNRQRYAELTKASQAEGADTRAIASRKRLLTEQHNEMVRGRAILHERIRVTQEHSRAVIDNANKNKDAMNMEAKQRGVVLAQHKEALVARKQHNDEAIRTEQAAAHARSVLMRKDAQDQINAIQREKELAQAKQQTLARTQAAGMAMMMTGALMSAAGIKGTSSFINMARASADFRREIAVAYTQVDGLNTGVGQLTRIALGVAREVPAAMDTIAPTIYDIFSSINVNVAEAEQLLHGFAREAVAGNSNIQDAARSTIAIMNGMRIGVEDLERVQDFQFQTVRKGVITYDELAANIGKVIPALRRAGQEIEIGGAMLAFLTRQGLSAEMSATAAARALELFADPRVVKRLEAQGFAVRNSSGEFMSFNSVLEQMAERWGNLPAPERAAEMLDVFGGAGYRIQARRFFDTVLPNFDLFQEHINWQLTKSGALQDAYDIMFAEPATKIQYLKNNMESLRIEMGQAFIPTIETLVQKGTQLVEWFSGLDRASREGLIRFVAMGAAATAILGIILTLGGAFVTVSSMVGYFFGSLKAGMLIAGGVPALLTLITTGLILLAFHWEEVTEWVKNFVDALGIGFTASGMFEAGILALGASFIIAHKHILAAWAALSKFALTLKALALNPYVIAFAALAGAIYLAGKESRETNRQVRNMSRELENTYNSTIANGASLLELEVQLRATARATAEQIVEERELNSWLNKNTSGTRAYVNAAVEGGQAHQRVLQELRGMREEASKTGPGLEMLYNNIISINQALGGSSTPWFFGLSSELGEVERAIALQKELREIQRRGTLELSAELKQRGNELEFQLGRWIALQEESIGVHKREEEAVKKNILDLIAKGIELDNLDPKVRDAILGNEEFAEAIGDVSSAADEAKDLLAGYAASYSMLDSVANSVLPRYKEALNDVNKAEQDLARERASGVDGADMEDFYTEVTVSLDLYMEKLNEVSEEMGWALEAQRTLRDKYTADVVSWWSDLYEQEPELAKAIYDELQEGETRHWEEMRKIRHGQMLFVLQDAAALGLEIVDEHGNWSELAVRIVAQQLNVLPEVAAASMAFMDDETREGLRKQQNTIRTETNEQARVAQQGGMRVADALNQGLSSGLLETRTRMRAYQTEILNGLNPILNSLGQQTLRIGTLREGNYTGLNAGGLVPGNGPDRDSVLAWLTPGEFVLRRKAVENLDPQSLHLLNNSGDLRVLQGHNRGGFVMPDDVPSPPTSFPPVQYPIDEPAKASTKKLYDETRAFVQKHGAPPLGSGIGWQAMWRAVVQRFPNALLHSAYRPGAITATGRPSYHGQGRAIDITPSMTIAKWIRDNYMSKTRELIFSPMGHQQVHNGRNHYYSGITRSMHWDHIHWAMANGGAGRVSQPTWFLAGENGPEDFAFSPVGMSKKQGDGPGLPMGENLSGGWAGGVFNIVGWMERFLPKYENVLRTTTQENLDSVNKLIGAVNAMQTHVSAQHALGEARRNVERLADEVIRLAREAEMAEVALENAWKQAREITPSEEIDIIGATRSLREATYNYESMARGVGSLNHELGILQQEQRIANMRRDLEELGETGAADNLDELRLSVQQAQAEFAKAQLELEIFHQQEPYITDPVQRLLAQFKAENQLAQSQEQLLEAQNALSDAQREQETDIYALRIAEIELMLAEERLLQMREAQQYQSEELREAYLNMLLAQESLTQAHADSIGPTQEVLDAQAELERIQQEQIDTALELTQARQTVTEAELAAVSATLQLVAAGQELTELGPRHFEFFREIAETAGMAEQNINRLVRVTRDLAGGSINPQAVIEGHTGRDRELVEAGFEAVYGRVKEIFDNRRVRIATETESATQRLTRITYEVLSGQRTLDDVRDSVDRLKRLNIGTYDSGGLLMPGTTLAINKTGKPEYVFTDSQLKALSKPSVVVEEGAVKLEFNGPIDSTSMEDVQDYVDKAFAELIKQIDSQ
jgi:TP901 family phage tail tape measure protein